ncbi:hypothetical protein N7520_008291 [Penicillium odoratum]|uniref:uncharacterized protein n=1 Tax=Penicillium odoratum TaxID=1167516 RepID=UPI00254894A6|nr:uncharacterized protein N7520_008291 [Penicillium odoratum]KAJ5761135.1 hypothetical protein N7520_008291 [Penicillium odoratum]
MSGATNVATSGGGGGKPPKKSGKTPADKVAEVSTYRKTPEALAVLKKALEAYQMSEDTPVAGSSKSRARHRRRRLAVARNQKEILEQIVQEGLPPKSRVGVANRVMEPKTPAKAKATSLS